MMRLSTKGRYGARLMLDLAVHYGNGPIFLGDIASRQEISEKYLGQLALTLKKAGLINSTRGAHGGYSLAKAPEDIALADVLYAVEGNIDVVECVSAPEVCNRLNSCVTRDIWGEISDKIANVLQSITLQEMVKRHDQKQQLHSLMYSI